MVKYANAGIQSKYFRDCLPDFYCGRTAIGSSNFGGVLISYSGTIKCCTSNNCNDVAFSSVGSFQCYENSNEIDYSDAPISYTLGSITTCAYGESCGVRILFYY